MRPSPEQWFYVGKCINCHGSVYKLRSCLTGNWVSTGEYKVEGGNQNCFHKWEEESVKKEELPEVKLH